MHYLFLSIAVVAEVVDSAALKFSGGFSKPLPSLIMVVSFMISLACFALALRARGAPRGIYTLRPDRMRVVPGAQGWPEAFEYTVAGRTLRFDQAGGQIAPILHCRSRIRSMTIIGFAPLAAAAIAIELSLVECPAFALTMLRALWTGHDAGIAGFAALSGLLMAYFGARFGVLGVYVAGRSREKQSAVTGETVPSIVAQVVKGLRGKR